MLVLFGILPASIQHDEPSFLNHFVQGVTPLDAPGSVETDGLGAHLPQRAQLRSATGAAPRKLQCGG